MPIRIGARFNGPPGFGNGGYSCGMIAAAIGEPVKVRLQRPVPIDSDLSIERTSADSWNVQANGEVIASATAHELQLDVPAPPTWIEAFGASHHFPGFAHHNFPHCFVCGPARADGDGLKIFPGAIPGTSILGAPWRPDISLADSAGQVRAEFIWAALDCPGYYAACEPRVALLGEFAVRVESTVHATQPHIVIAWSLSSQGRKHVAGTALFDAQGKRCAFAQATWIELKDAPPSVPSM